jgi:hypothetical protein
MSAHDKSLIPFQPAELRPRHDGWTAQKQIAFIEALAETACVEEACRRVGMSDSAAYRLRRRPCGWAFRRAWDAALDYALHRLEQAVLSRALNGVPRPVFYKGEQVGEWRYHDERLAMFLLRSRRPARYGKWVDRVLAPDPDAEEESAGLLECELDEIAERAPEEGNPEEDWQWDSPPRVEE